MVAVAVIVRDPPGPVSVSVKARSYPEMAPSIVPVGNNPHGFEGVIGSTIP
jgi:hypothetical protein